MSEKIGGAKGTELDDDFVLMEKVCAALCLVGCAHLTKLQVANAAYCCLALQ